MTIEHDYRLAEGRFETAEDYLNDWAHADDPIYVEQWRYRRPVNDGSGARALLVVVCGALVLSLFALHTQWDRITGPDDEQASLTWEVRR